MPFEKNSKAKPKQRNWSEQLDYVKSKRKTNGRGTSGKKSWEELNL